jgi:hypothetical protein
MVKWEIWDDGMCAHPLDAPFSGVKKLACRRKGTDHKVRKEGPCMTFVLVVMLSSASSVFYLGERNAWFMTAVPSIWTKEIEWI